MSGYAGKAAGWRRSWWMVAAAALGVVGLAGWATSGEPSSSSCLLRVDGDPGHAPGDGDRLVANLVGLAGDRRSLESALQAHPEILQFPVAARQVDPIAWLGASVSIEPVAGTDLIRITGRGESPLLAATITNAVADAIVKDSMLDRSERFHFRVAQLEAARLEAEREAARLRQAFRERGSSSEGGIATSVRAEAEADDLREIHKDLRRVRLEKKTVEVRLAANKAPSADLADAVAVLAAREALLVESEKATAEALARAEVSWLDFEAARDELARADARARAIEDRLGRLQTEGRDPVIVRKVSSAKPMPK